MNSSSDNNGDTVQANYNKLSDHIRRLTPHGIQCSMFCGGLNCKYENPENWKPDSLALQGIYSHWVTDEILAMARPSTLVIIQKNIMQQFETLGIKSIINLQCPREHSNCGQPLESSGFSYDPNVFMEQNIYYYNFAWKDYGEATVEGLLNMVKVIAFALTEGRVAIHCHAGLGRTGVLIACYLVYSLRVTANDAIRYVRLKRPGSVQTRGQILCVRHFAQCILPKTITYYLPENVPKDKHQREFTLQSHLKRQRVSLHGYEERNFKYLPKIVYVICERILKLCSCDEAEDVKHANLPFTVNFLTEKLHEPVKRHESTYSLASICSPISETILLNPPDSSPTPSSPNIDNTDSFSDVSTLDCDDEISEEMLLENKCFHEIETQKEFAVKQVESELVIRDIQEAVGALLSDFYSLDEQTRAKIIAYENEINRSKMGWMKLAVETDLVILANLLFEWLEGLKVPILQTHNFEDIVILYKKPEECFKRIGLEESYLIEYMLKFVTKLQPITHKWQRLVLTRLIASLSKHSVQLNAKSIPTEKDFRRIGEGTLSCTLKFFQAMLEMIDNHHAFTE